MISYGTLRKTDSHTKNLFSGRRRELADWITTYGGIHFFPLEPEADKIEITDVAHALSLICRGNGHVKTFFQ